MMNKETNNLVKYEFNENIINIINNVIKKQIPSLIDSISIIESIDKKKLQQLKKDFDSKQQ